MAEFILECKCKQMQIYQKWAKGTPNKKHWVIRCKNCDAYVETVKKEKAIELWNSWDMYHKNKIHTELNENKQITESVIERKCKQTYEPTKTCFDCKYHFMSDCYLECQIKNRINYDNICESFEQLEVKDNESN